MPVIASFDFGPNARIKTPDGPLRVGREKDGQEFVVDGELEVTFQTEGLKRDAPYTSLHLKLDPRREGSEQDVILLVSKKDQKLFEIRGDGRVFVHSGLHLKGHRISGVAQPEQPSDAVPYQFLQDAIAADRTLLLEAIESSKAAPQRSDLSLAGHRLTEVGEPKSPDDAATAGHVFKQSVRAAYAVIGNLETYKKVRTRFLGGTQVEVIPIRNGDDALLLQSVHGGYKFFPFNEKFLCDLSVVGAGGRDQSKIEPYTGYDLRLIGGAADRLAVIASPTGKLPRLPSGFEYVSSPVGFVSMTQEQGWKIQPFEQIGNKWWYRPEAQENGPGGVPFLHLGRWSTPSDMDLSCVMPLGASMAFLWVEALGTPGSMVQIFDSNKTCLASFEAGTKTVLPVALCRSRLSYAWNQPVASGFGLNLSVIAFEIV